jgi:hypothetical protein
MCCPTLDTQRLPVCSDERQAPAGHVRFGVQTVAFVVVGDGVVTAVGLVAHAGPAPYATLASVYDRVLVICPKLPALHLALNVRGRESVGADAQSGDSSKFAVPVHACVPAHPQEQVSGDAVTLVCTVSGVPNPLGQVACGNATGCHPIGISTHVEGAGVHGLNVPVESQVCVAPALHVAALPHTTVVPGTHIPEHAPALQTNGQDVPLCHLPASSQVCGMLPEHCVEPGTQFPEHAPVTHAYGHCSVSIHVPVAVQR